MKVAPLGGIMVLKAKVAIELVDELAKLPYLVRQLSVFSHQACSGMPLAVGL